MAKLNLENIEKLTIQSTLLILQWARHQRKISNGFSHDSTHRERAILLSELIDILNKNIESFVMEG